MKPDRLNKVQTAVELQFIAAQKRVQPILAEEQRLRSQLMQVRRQEVENQDATGDHSLQSTGAEIAWRAWLSKTQRGLNIELAQVMARKLPALEEVRAAFGRQEAMRLVVEKERQRKQQNQSKHR